MNALFSEIVAFVAEAMYIHKKTGAAKSSSKVHQLSHEVATRVLKGEDPGNDLMSDLSVNIRSDPSYGEFTYGTVPYNGIS